MQVLVFEAFVTERLKNRHADHMDRKTLCAWAAAVDLKGRLQLEREAARTRTPRFWSRHTTGSAVHSKNASFTSAVVHHALVTSLWRNSPGASPQPHNFRYITLMHRTGRIERRSNTSSAQRANAQTLTDQRFQELLQSASAFFAHAQAYSEKERQAVICEIRSQMDAYGLTTADLM